MQWAGRGRYRRPWGRDTCNPPIVGGGAGGQLAFMFVFAALLFLAGIFVGGGLFDHTAHWSDWTKKTSLPNNVRFRKPAAPVDVPATAPGGQGGASVGGGTPNQPVAPPPAVAAPSEAAVPVAGGVPTLAEVTEKGLDWYAVFEGRQQVELDHALDSPRVSFGAWIYLDSQDKGANIKTIASTRSGGCAVDDAHRGWSFYVNQWATNDRSLVLEWRNSAGTGGGCAQLASDTGTIPYDKWVHVGFAMDTGAWA